MLPTPPCLCWSSDAKSFFALDNGANVVRRYSFPDLREEAKLAIGKECSWLCPCRDGILVTVTESQEAWILDETTLQKKSAFAVGKTPQVVSSRTSAYAYSVSDDRHFAELTINDIRTGRPVSQERIEGMASEFGTIALSPDGRRLFTVGHGLTLHAHAVDGAKVEQVAGSPGLGNGRFTGMSFSPDGEYICVPTGGGNGQFNGFERVPYGTLIFQSTDITTPVLQIKTGAYPTAVGFDMKSGLIYGQNFRENLIVFNDGGIRLKSFTVHKGRADITQFLVHPDGRRLVVLAENSGDTGATAIAVELPVPK
jgi:hypothetical protein